MEYLFQYFLLLRNCPLNGLTDKPLIRYTFSCCLFLNSKKKFFRKSNTDEFAFRL